MIKYGELIETLGQFTLVDVHDLIPDEFYRAVIKLAIKKNKQERTWDIQHVAAVLLYVAFHHDKIHPSQLNTEGLRALDWAELLIEDETVEVTNDAQKKASDKQA